MSTVERETRQAELVRLFTMAPIRQSMRMDLHYDAEGRAVFDLPYELRYEHSLGAIHGGVLATMLDNAGWFTVAPLFDTWISTVEIQVRYLEAARNKQALRATGRILKAGKRLCVAEMDVRTDTNDLIAVGSGSFLVTALPFKVPTP